MDYQRKYVLLSLPILHYDLCVVLMFFFIFLREDPRHCVPPGQHPLQDGILLHPVTAGVPGEIHQEMFSLVAREESQYYGEFGQHLQYPH